MSTARVYDPISVEDYLRGEETANWKHEFVEGIVYAMGGGTNAHNRIATNVTGILFAQLRGSKYQVFNSDTKIRIQLAHGTRFYYPDVSVVCHVNPPGDTFHDAPVVVVEVLSESTRRIDEHEKREAYLTIDSLRAYLLVESSAATALAYRRVDAGFQREVYSGVDAVISLPEIACQLRLGDLYENVAFAPRTGEEP